MSWHHHQSLRFRESLSAASSVIVPNSVEIDRTIAEISQSLDLNFQRFIWFSKVRTFTSRYRAKCRRNQSNRCRGLTVFKMAAVRHLGDSVSGLARMVMRSVWPRSSIDGSLSLIPSVLVVWKARSSRCAVVEWVARCCGQGECRQGVTVEWVAKCCGQGEWLVRSVCQGVFVQCEWPGVVVVRVSDWTCPFVKVWLLSAGEKLASRRTSTTPQNCRVLSFVESATVGGSLRESREVLNDKC